MEEVKEGNNHGAESNEVSPRFTARRALVKVVLPVVSIFVFAGLTFGFVTFLLGWFVLVISLVLLSQILPIWFGVIILLVIIEKVTKWERLAPLRTFLFKAFLFCGVYFAISELFIMGIQTT